eukprot:3582553-Pleurochrysis_carterae.AAC.2
MTVLHTCEKATGPVIISAWVCKLWKASRTGQERREGVLHNVLASSSAGWGGMYGETRLAREIEWNQGQGERDKTGDRGTQGEGIKGAVQKLKSKEACSG